MGLNRNLDGRERFAAALSGAKDDQPAQLTLTVETEKAFGGPRVAVVRTQRRIALLAAGRAAAKEEIVAHGDTCRVKQMKLR
jgi:hypothetical protein